METFLMRSLLFLALVALLAACGKPTEPPKAAPVAAEESQMSGKNTAPAPEKPEGGEQAPELSAEEKKKFRF
jgi:predicted small lipoprotein YifL